MVRTPEHELETFYRHVDGSEERRDHISVILGAKVDQFDGSFEVVQEAMDISEQDFDRASGAEEVGELQHGDEVTTVRPACCCGTCVGA